ncbi:hypothetical protein [Vallitalea guaymasensis]|uniref:hypothetical protein n=1 Tax=Vallitalea guaymasensis TaxID=1185412 RepID=UPI000DE367A0|nr:hypothetical protein [Vallitalea guaymasensis]
MARKTKSADVETVENVEVMTFSKEKIISAKKYSNRKDILNELLDDGKEYSFDQVDKLMDDYMKGKVK